MLATAPRVVKPAPGHREQQRREVRARRDREREPDHERDVLALEHDRRAGSRARRARPSRAARRAAARARSILPRRTTWPHRSCASAAAPDSVRPATTARIVANATAEMKPRKPVPPSTSASSGAAMLPPLSTALDRVAADEHRRAEAEHERDEVEEADQARRVGDRAPRGLRVGHRVEPHQDVRQPRGAEHQRDARARSPRAASRPACPARARRRRTARAPRRTARAGSSRTPRARARRASVAPSRSRPGLDDLDPGRRDHPAEQDVEQHHAADERDRRAVRQAEQQVDQAARADHLRDQVERDDRERADRGGDPHRALAQAIRDDVGERVLAEVAQRLGDQERDHRPADEPADRVDQAVEARSARPGPRCRGSSPRSCSRPRARSRSGRPTP